VYNPWPIIGGVGISVVAKGEFKEVNKSEAGDVILLTKPIGTQIVVGVDCLIQGECEVMVFVKKR
jgi:selenide,water dikinase